MRLQHPLMKKFGGRSEKTSQLMLPEARQTQVRSVQQLLNLGTMTLAIQALLGEWIQAQKLRMLAIQALLGELTQFRWTLLVPRGCAWSCTWSKFGSNDS